VVVGAHVVPVGPGNVPVGTRQEAPPPPSLRMNGADCPAITATQVVNPDATLVLADTAERVVGTGRQLRGVVLGFNVQMCDIVPKSSFLQFGFARSMLRQTSSSHEPVGSLHTLVTVLGLTVMSMQLACSSQDSKPPDAACALSKRVAKPSKITMTAEKCMFAGPICRRSM
jgi:hypothetical protein